MQWSEQVIVHTAVSPSIPLGLAHVTSLRYRDALIYEWQAPLYTGGSNLQQYTLEITEVETNTISEILLTVQATTYKFDGLNPSTDYSVRIKVNNLVGESDWSEQVDATTGIEPTRPGLFTFVESTRTTLKLSWDLLQGADTGGSDENPLQIIWYHLYLDDGLGGLMNLHDSVDGTTSEFLMQYLKSGLTYRFQL